MAHKGHPGKPHDWLYLGIDTRVDMPGDRTYKDHHIWVCAIPTCWRDRSRPVASEQREQGK